MAKLAVRVAQTSLSAWRDALPRRIGQQVSGIFPSDGIKFRELALGWKSLELLPRVRASVWGDLIYERLSILSPSSKRASRCVGIMRARGACLV